MKMATIRIFCLLFIFGFSEGFLLDDNSLQYLMSQLINEQNIRANLATEIHTLKTNMATMTADYKANRCFTGVVAFSASVINDTTPFGIKQRVIYDRVTTNVGGAYDARHGTFRAPVDGVYEFAVSVLQGDSSMWLGLEVVKNYDQVIARVKTGDNGYWNTGSNVVNVRLQKGDDIWVRHMSKGDSNHLVGQKGLFTTFSGHLIN
ncbi:hypothetical protein ACF0H5_014918 [Mactra antiquata]